MRGPFVSGSPEARLAVVSNRDLAGIRVVAFDAVGTLLYAMPSVTQAYCEVISRVSGRPVDPDAVRAVLGVRLRERSREPNLSTSEAAERDFWYRLISELVPDPVYLDRCFQELHSHFANAECWRCFDDVPELLRKLRSRGLRILVASNFDERLHSVCRGLPELCQLDDIVVSSEVGWRKPAKEFFDRVCQWTNCLPEEILFVGDDLENDIRGALNAGLHAVLIDRSGATNDLRSSTEMDACGLAFRRISSLNNLLSDG